MKKVNLITQSKGGSGKSFVTWMFAYINKESDAIFIDLDQSTRTSYNRLSNVLDKNRILSKSIIDNNKKLDREKFLDLFEEIYNSEASEWYIDFGATESEELKLFFETNYSAHELKETLDELEIELNIFVIIAGNDAFKASISYLNDLRSIINNTFPIIALKNEGTFKDLIEKDSSDLILKTAKINYHKVANTPIGGSSTSIIQLIGGDLKEEELKLAAKLGLKKMIDNFKNTIQ